MCEPTLTHQIISFDRCVDILLVDTNGDTHQHVLWTLYDLAVDRWVKLDSAILPAALGMNYNLVYDSMHNALLLVIGDENMPTAVWALKLRL